MSGTLPGLIFLAMGFGRTTIATFDPALEFPEATFQCRGARARIFRYLRGGGGVFSRFPRGGWSR